MIIHVFTDIADPFLKAQWERLEKEGEVFPQSSYHWCATWWKYLSGRRKLHVVMALDESGSAVAIAPLCIERHWGMWVLRSFPIHFGDFYTFIVSPTGNAEDAARAVVDHMLSNKSWQWVRLEQVPEYSDLRQQLNQKSFRSKRMTGCVIAEFEGFAWEEYLQRLKKSFRKHVRNRLRKIEGRFSPSLRIARTWEEYEPQFQGMLDTHARRWIDDRSPKKGSVDIDCLQEAVRGQFERGAMVYYTLMLNDLPVAYRLGFIVSETFYSWHTSFDPEYRSFHVGVMILAFMIPHLMKNRIRRINFMAGDYDWKLDWSPEKRVEANYMYSSPSNNLPAAMLNGYHHHVRDQIKSVYHGMMRNGFLRMLSRNVIVLRQKLAGK